MRRATRQKKLNPRPLSSRVAVEGLDRTPHRAFLRALDAP